MKEEQKKILVFAGALLGAYALYKLLVDKKSPTKAVSESVEVVTDTAKKVVKKAAYLIKGSPEAKEHMKKLASMRGKNKKKTKAITDEQIIKKHNLKGKAAEAVRSGKVIKKKKKKIRGEAGGKATATKGPHKGHKTKKGLSQDQKRISKEKHEKQYQKKKK